VAKQRKTVKIIQVLKNSLLQFEFILLFVFSMTPLSLTNSDLFAFSVFCVYVYYGIGLVAKATIAFWVDIHKNFCRGN